jgi:hypothetical protein
MLEKKTSPHLVEYYLSIDLIQIAERVLVIHARDVWVERLAFVESDNFFFCGS